MRRQTIGRPRHRDILPSQHASLLQHTTTLWWTLRRLAMVPQRGRLLVLLARWVLVLVLAMARVLVLAMVLVLGLGLKLGLGLGLGLGMLRVHTHPHPAIVQNARSLLAPVAPLIMPMSTPNRQVNGCRRMIDCVRTWSLPKSCRRSLTRKMKNSWYEPPAPRRATAGRKLSVGRMCRLGSDPPRVVMCQACAGDADNMG